MKKFSIQGPGGIFVFVGALAVAFVLGGFLFGGGEPPPEPVAEHEGHTVWTCSMHPNVRLPGPGQCPICAMDLIPVEVDPGVVGPRQLRMSEAAREIARVRTAVASRVFAETEIRMYGKLAYDDSKLAYITAWVPGRLDRVYADYAGIPVRKGDHLVDIYSPELLATQEEFLQARAAVTSLSASASSALRSTATATLSATREKLRLFGLTPEQIETLEKTGNTSDHLTIYAPIGGIVVHKDAREGMYVSTGSRIFTIADLRKLWVLFQAYESDLPWLRYGQRVQFTSQSFPGETFEGIVSFIDPLVDPGTRTVAVRAVVENPGGRLKPDMFVRGVVKSRTDGEGHILDVSLANKHICPMHPEVIRDRPGTCNICGMNLVPSASLGYIASTDVKRETPLLIPATAPLITGKRAVVYVEVPNEAGPLYEGREVELGPRAGEFYVVHSGIEEGERVVTHGAFKIDSELQIQAKPSMMSPAGAGAGAPPSHHHAMTGDEKPAPKTSPPARTASPALWVTLGPVYDAYFDVQMALAKDDLDSARVASAELKKRTDAVKAAVFSKAEQKHWKKLSPMIAEATGKLAASKDIHSARDAFYDLSKAAIDLHAAFGHAGTETFYLTHCPMARGNQGAHWLQKVDVVWNSYYGASMLRCGTIQEKYVPAKMGNGP